MKALSVRQPWAWHIAEGRKTIECRTWGTGYRGPLLICASAAKYTTSAGLVLPHGAALCLVDLVDVRRMVDADRKAARMDGILYADFDVDRHKAWVLANPRPVQQAPVKGRLHLFEVPDDLIIVMAG